MLIIYRKFHTAKKKQTMISWLPFLYTTILTALPPDTVISIYVTLIKKRKRKSEEGDF